MGNLLSKLLEFIPKSAQVVIASLFVGGLSFAGMDARYMTVSDFTKSFVLDLKSEIRSLSKDIRDPELPEDVKEFMRDQLEELIDELCYQNPDDPYCEGRELE
jgi:hypothetical protein